MIHGALTLLNRSVRGDALKAQAHWVRLGSILVLLLFLFAAHFNSSDFSAPGLEFFRSIAYLGVALISLAGVGHFSNSITEEKEEGTLGLLLLANISPLAILLGKSTNRVLSAILIFVAQFPFALLAITLGGLTITQIFATYIALAGFLFLVANLSLLASVMSRKSSEASALVLVLLFVVLGLPPSIKASFDRLVGLGIVSSGNTFVSLAANVNDFYHRTSITDQIGKIFEPNGTYSIFSAQLLFSVATGTLFFLLAWLQFRKIVWTPDQLEPRRITVTAKKRRWSILISRPWSQAMGWKDFYFLTGGPLLILIKVIVYPVWVYSCIRYSPQLMKYAAVEGGQFARDSLLIIFIVEALLLASQFYHNERKMGTLPTLLMLPHSVGQISYGKLFGCLLSLVPTMVAIIATELILDYRGRGELIVFSQKMVLALCLLLVVCHLTVLCSLIAKWGALPLAIGLSLIVGVFTAPFVAAAMSIIASADQGALAEISPALYATGIFVAAAQLEIGRRLKWIAGS